MDHTYADEKSLKSLEDLSVYLTTAMVSLITLQNAQVQAIEIGIMKEDMNERANTIVWDLRRLMKLYKDQLEATLELLPDDFTAGDTIRKLQAENMKRARAIAKEAKEKKND